ncbi:MAG: peptidoglycan-binding protein [Actinomycetia bacterium]|nr:peptidoglycan-binding protein [Actinomycetes bacterium]
MRMGRVTVVIMAFGVLAASCGGDDAADTTSSSSTTIQQTSTTAATTTTTTIPPTTTISAGSSIPATATITVVQGDLKLLGHFDGVVDGIAGQLTQEAIKSFQGDAGIEADGEYGPITDAELAKALKNNTEYVTDLQEHLAEDDLYSGPIDGDYGKGTQQAVEAFQKSCEVEETGSLDINTRLCLEGF